MPFLTWIQFLTCLAAIGIAGVKLSQYGDAFADKTGLGGTWIGLIMPATVTSLPELITGVTSVNIADVPDIAVGDLLGSCVFNLLILLVLIYMTNAYVIYLHGE